MPQSLAWLTEKQIIMTHVIGDISLEESHAANVETAAYLDAGEPPVHILADIKQMGRFPLNLIAARKTTTYLQHPNLGYIAVYGASGITSSFVQILMSLAGVKVRFVRDYAEGIAYLAQHDPRIKAALEAGTLPTEA